MLDGLSNHENNVLNKIRNYMEMIYIFMAIIAMMPRLRCFLFEIFRNSLATKVRKVDILKIILYSPAAFHPLLVSLR